MPEVAGTMRGTVCTSGIEDLRGGAFRRKQAAFSRRASTTTGGAGPPARRTRISSTLVDDENKFGAALRRGLVDRISRQLLLGVHGRGAAGPRQPRHASIRAIRISSATSGRCSPTISRTIRSTASPIRAQLSRQIFQRLGAEDHTAYDPLDYGYVSYKGEGIRHPRRQPLGRHSHHGHRARRTRWSTARQRSWDHANLYLAGAGSMPTIGTSNTTLTLAALCFLSAEHIARRTHRARHARVGATIAPVDVMT